MSFQQTVFRTKRDVAVEAIRNEIIAGRLAPETRLILEELSQQLGLSLTPIREALPVLEGEGLIVQLPHRGAIVAPMDREEILELYAIRGGLESMVTRQAVSRITEEDLDAMAALIDDMTRLEGDWAHFLERDMAFHLVLYGAAGSRRWLETIETLWKRSKRYMISSTAMIGEVTRIHADHRALLDACRAGDADAAASVTHNHLVQSEERLLHEWETAGLTAT
ncbi:MAG: GntR family transcriptional regulator [Thermomicrobiales bacterium]|nr:GntR family transcriptional regulator [Thermomicrobiales bacterium]